MALLGLTPYDLNPDLMQLTTENQLLIDIALYNQSMQSLLTTMNSNRLVAIPNFFNSGVTLAALPANVIHAINSCVGGSFAVNINYSSIYGANIKNIIWNVADSALTVCASLNIWLFNTSITAVTDSTLLAFNYSNWAGKFIGCFKLWQVSTTPLATGGGASFQLNPGGTRATQAPIPCKGGDTSMSCIITTDTAFTTTAAGGTKANEIYIDYDQITTTL